MMLYQKVNLGDSEMLVLYDGKISYGLENKLLEGNKKVSGKFFKMGEKEFILFSIYNFLDAIETLELTHIYMILSDYYKNRDIDSWATL